MIDPDPLAEIKANLPHTYSVATLAAWCERLVGEVERLRGLLEQHGISPDQPPSF
jgi:hypothetical protein